MSDLLDNIPVTVHVVADNSTVEGYAVTEQTPWNATVIMVNFTYDSTNRAHHFDRATGEQWGMPEDDPDFGGFYIDPRP
jgi:hypothetical protein